MKAQAPGSRTSQTEAKVDGLLARMSSRRKESIARSMERPLKLELLRTGYIALCILVDVLLLPILGAELLGRLWLVAVPLALVPVVYAEYLAHHRWFPLPARWSAGRGP